MKKYLAFFLILLFPIFADAQCSSERLIELNKIANNINLSYTYEVKDMDALFQITVSNLTEDVYLYSEDENITVSGKGEKIIDQKIPSGKSLIFVVYSNDASCKGEALSSKYLNLPHYNYYSEYGYCKVYPEHKYCQKWFDPSTLSRTEFDKEMYSYMNKKAEKEQSSKEEKEKTKLDKIIEIWNENRIIIISAFVLIISLTVVLIVKKRKNI